MHAVSLLCFVYKIVSNPNWSSVNKNKGIVLNELKKNVINQLSYYIRNISDLICKMADCFVSILAHTYPSLCQLSYFDKW